jgi:hypothetical protein
MAGDNSANGVTSSKQTLRNSEPFGSSETNRFYFPHRTVPKSILLSHLDSTFMSFPFRVPQFLIQW